MKTDLLASELINNLSEEADTLYKQYHTTLSTLIDKRTTSYETYQDEVHSRKS